MTRKRRGFDTNLDAEGDFSFKIVCIEFIAYVVTAA
jgi:hypothetical protein